MTGARTATHDAATTAPVRLVGWLVGWLVDRLAGWLAGSLTGWLVRRVGWSVGGSIDWLESVLDWLIGCPVGSVVASWLIGWLVVLGGRPAGSSDGRCTYWLGGLVGRLVDRLVRWSVGRKVVGLKRLFRRDAKQCHHAARNVASRSVLAHFAHFAPFFVLLLLMWFLFSLLFVEVIFDRFLTAMFLV